MNAAVARIGLVASAFLFSLAPSSPLNAGSFKIKPVALTGDPAPDGGVFTVISSFGLNRRGDIVFDGRTSIGAGSYLVTGDTISLLPTLPTDTVQSVAGFVVDPASLGFTLLPEDRCEWNDAPSCFRFRFTDSQGFHREFECIKEFESPLTRAHVEDTYLVSLGSDGSSPDGGLALFSGGSLRWVSCPLGTYFAAVVYPNISSYEVAPVGLTNTGAIGVVFPTNSGGLAVALISGGNASITNFKGLAAPGGGTIVRLGQVKMNENTTFLVPFLTSTSSEASDGLLLLRSGLIVPVAFKGMEALGGGKFQSFSGWVSRTVVSNDAEHVAFGAELDNGGGGIFRRNPDGTLMPLAQNITSDPITGIRLSINQAGDLAALILNSVLNPNQGREIRFLSSRGEPSKVVGIGDPGPEGTTFQVVDNPQVTNEGAIVFWASLSDGRSGIFVASGLEMDFVDPVPDLLAGPTVTSDTSALAKSEAIVEGIAADGVAQVVVRVKAGESGTVDLSLVDANGTALPASNLNGSLSPVGQEAGAATVSVPTEDVNGVGPMAFASYHAPADFAGSPTSAEANLADRTIFIKAKLTTSSGETIESTEPLTIIRPPVVLVHGLWSNRTTWDFFGGLSPQSPDPRFQIFTVDYPGTDAFAPSADVTLAQLADIVGDFKKGTNPAGTSVAAIQADIVAHSMGGNVTRTMVTKSESGRDDNFLKGEVHKLITIDSPHLGSHLANRLVDSNIICRLVFWLSGHPIAGAVEDLALGSSALQSLQEPLSSGLPTHVLAGIASGAQEQSAQENFQTFAFGLAQLICPSLLPAGGFQEIFGGPNDLLVSAASQAATGLSISGGSPPATVTNGIIHSVISGLFTLGPDSLSRDLIDGQPTEVPTPNPQRVIGLLNEPMTGASFAPIRP